MTKEERLQKQLERLGEMRAMEDDLHRRGIRYIAGVDEVGRGPLAGPVVTAAVVLPEGFDVPGIDDSKKLSEKKRQQLYEIIMERSLAVGIGQVSHEVIDEINILNGTKLAMKKAIEEAEEDLVRRTENKDASIGHVLIDAVELEGLEKPQKAVVKGDSKILCIAAASIIAKVTRDKMMVGYSRMYPHYGFENNKGYGTKAHYEGIKNHGICPIHRRTFLKGYV